MNESASVQKGGDENGCIHLLQIFEENSALVHPTLDGVTTYWVKLTCETKDFSFWCAHACISCSQASFQRSNSHDKVRKIVAEEGRTARNLIAWSVPLENKEDDGMRLTVQPLHFHSSGSWSCPSGNIFLA